MHIGRNVAVGVSNSASNVISGTWLRVMCIACKLSLEVGHLNRRRSPSLTTTIEGEVAAEDRSATVPMFRAFE